MGESKPLWAREQETLLSLSRRLIVRGLLAVVPVLGLLVYLFPGIVARSGAVGTFVRSHAPDGYQMTLGSASLGWSTPTTLHDLTLKSADGELTLNVAAINLNANFIDLLSGSLGDRLLVDDPKLVLDDPKVADRMKQLLASFEPGGESSPRWKTIRCTGASVVVETGDDHWELSDGEFLLHHDVDPVATLHLEGKATCRHGDQQGSLSLTALRRQAAEGRADKFSWTVEARTLPWDAFDALLASSGSTIRLDGGWDGTFEGSWQSEPPTLELKSNLESAKMTVSGIRGTKSITLRKVEVPVEISLEKGQLRVVPNTISSTVGSATLWGDIAASGPIRSWRPLDVSLRVACDLPKLKAAAPWSLPDGAAYLSTGQLLAEGQSRHTGEKAVWTASVKTSHLVGVVNGMTKVWPDLFAADVAFSERPGQELMVDSLSIKSLIGDMTASGPFSALKGTINANIGRIAGLMQEKYGRPMPVTGFAQGTFQLNGLPRPPAYGQTTLKMSGTSLQRPLFNHTAPQDRVWNGDVNLTGRWDEKGRVWVDSGTIDLTYKGQPLAIRVLHPEIVAGPGRVSAVPVMFSGDVIQWHRRLAVLRKIIPNPNHPKVSLFDVIFRLPTSTEGVIRIAGQRDSAQVR
ncbi:hypothetical protein Pan216_43030 [Planctomycetes bacterium Pan216]|uniref:AsmA-like C-terminal domain-containing protein n=1 Tax=Kolteria novifilia TaxID=2527975 RepID=A0A518B8Y4_9BACT|nr:hypothetical protein Pan216_43030 [Planctomycetes bacterium Pan216]